MIKDVVEQLSLLNQKFYKKCGELYEAMEFLGAKLYNEMLQNYFELYRTEYNILMTEAKILYKNKYFVLRLLNKKLVPKNCGFLWLKNNEAKQLTKRETEFQVKSNFELRRIALEADEERLNPAPLPESSSPPSDNVPAVQTGGSAPPAPAPELADKDKPTTAQKPPETPKRTRKAKAAPADVHENSGQLQGQINIEEINCK